MPNPKDYFSSFEVGNVVYYYNGMECEIGCGKIVEKTFIGYVIEGQNRLHRLPFKFVYKSAEDCIKHQHHMLKKLSKRKVVQFD